MVLFYILEIINYIACGLALGFGIIIIPYSISNLFIYVWSKIIKFKDVLKNERNNKVR